MYYIIYKTTNTVNGKYYIGVHNGTKDNYLGSGKALLNAIKEHGRENFVRETLEVFDTESEAYLREAQLVDETVVADRNSYNVSKGGKGGPGQSKSKEHIDAIKRNHLRKSNPGAGRPPAMEIGELVELVNEVGLREAAKKLNVSYTALQGRYYRNIKKFKKNTDNG